MTTFRLKMLPAADGDCLLLSWGDGPLHHMVIDGGRKSAYPHLNDELAAIADKGERLALYVLTHVDADHIEGALAYLKDVNRPLLPQQVWHNGYDEMRRVSSLNTRSVRQGDEWSKAIARLRLPMNLPFDDRVASVETAGSAPIEIEGLRITLLSPTSEQLARMWSEWEERRSDSAARGEDMRASAGRSTAPFPSPIVVEDLIAGGATDTKAPNGSSIAFVAEWKGRRVLLSGDAHPDVLAASIRPLAKREGSGRYRVDLLKASHHGSKKNTSRELIELLDCRQMAISTSGAMHDHPDPESIAQFLHFGPSGPKRLWFNYSTSRTEPWGDPLIQKQHDYLAFYPQQTAGVGMIDIMADPEGQISESELNEALDPASGLLDN
ncbi:ComEC/Rec2 family competence protein [Sphingomonas lacusdianchii]|uniref:ComEC/Rec2 family competence protein n=1 Tax=Sphingomonas lacusdianchii TaxID=2917992 RepID=UPI001F577927|nr:hypothetical protein [Sphingomonas sp. JXJ CY 53]